MEFYSCCSIRNGLILNSFTLEIAHGLGINHIWWREYLICFGQIAWQFSVVALFDKSKGMEYLGNMSTVSFVGGLLLIPVLYLESQFNLGLYYLIPAFLAVVLFMFFEHIRRCKILKLPLGMTASWIAYRVFVLAIIIAVSYFSF